MDIVIKQTRVYGGIGMKHAGDRVTCDDALAQQLCDQGFAERAPKVKRMVETTPAAMPQSED